MTKEIETEYPDTNSISQRSVGCKSESENILVSYHSFSMAILGVWESNNFDYANHESNSVCRISRSALK